MMRPTDDGGRLPQELPELVAPPSRRVRRRDGGVEAELLGDRLDPEGVVAVGDEHDVGRCPAGRNRADAASDSHVLVPSTSFSSAASGTPWSRGSCSPRSASVKRSPAWRPPVSDDRGRRGPAS